MTQPQTILCPRCHKPGRREARFCQHCGFDMVLNNSGPRYYITRIVKAGGQGAVYETVGDDGNIYAVKEMLDSFTEADERAEAVERFEAEAKLLERLSHPRIPRVYTHFKDEGRHYLSMDFVRGEDLEEIVAREGAIPEQRMLDWAGQICDVLGYLHDSGLIYRDMKPSNVMVDQQNGGIKLVDFGIAKVLQRGQRGTQIGTPGYAPPEQYQGIATRESDIYALGATMHHLLTGRDPQAHPPFTFPAARDLNATISKRTSDAIGRALQMKAEDRFHSLDEFCAALGLNTVRQPAVAPPAQPRAPAPQPQAAPAPQPTRPRPAPAQPASPPAPAQSAARPAAAPVARQGAKAAPAPPAPAAPPATKAAPPAAAKPQRRRGRGCLTFITMLAALALLFGAYAVFINPSAVNIPFLTQPTPQTLILQPYATEAEIIVPKGTDQAGLKSAFEYAFLELARRQYGQGVQLQPNSLQYSATNPPAQIGEDAQGVRYRASLEGFILVPQQ